MDATFSFLLKVPDQVGCMVISERAILMSHGELANSEETAKTVLQLLHASRLFKPLSANAEGFESITVQFLKRSYIITKTGNYVCVVKRKLATVTDEDLNA